MLTDDEFRAMLQECAHELNALNFGGDDFPLISQPLEVIDFTDNAEMAKPAAAKRPARPMRQPSKTPHSTS